MIAIGALIVVLALALLGVPIGLAMLLGAFAGLSLILGTGHALVFLDQAVFWTPVSYTLATVPLFIFMGALVGATGIMEELYRAIRRLLGGIPGALAHATVTGAALFAAVSGSQLASAGLFTRISMPEMIAHGYSPAFTAGLIAAAATMAVMIPPSLTMIMYGILTETPIGQLFIAGIVPGIIDAVLLYAAITLVAWRRPDWLGGRGHRGAGPAQGIRGAAQPVASTLWLFSLVGLIMGGIYTGFFTPSQAGAIGASGALVMYVVRWRRATAGLWDVTRDTVLLSASLFIIIIGAILFSRLLTLSGLLSTTIEVIAELETPPWQILLLIIAVYVLLGQIFDAMSLAVLTLPAVFPIVTQLGYDPVWFGVIFVQMVEIGAMTPPLGLNVFTVAAASGGRVSVGRAFMGTLPLATLELLVLGLLIVFPQLVLWLPGTMQN